MSALTDRIAREHFTVSWDYPDELPVCSCGEMFSSEITMAAHVAGVTERAVRAQVAADITEHVTERRLNRVGKPGDLIDTAYNHAARIARDGFPYDHPARASVHRDTDGPAEYVRQLARRLCLPEVPIPAAFRRKPRCYDCGRADGGCDRIVEV